MACTEYLVYITHSITQQRIAVISIAQCHLQELEVIQQRPPVVHCYRGAANS
jgi:hypothetical protein